VSLHLTRGGAHKLLGFAYQLVKVEHPALLIFSEDTISACRISTMLQKLTYTLKNTATGELGYGKHKSEYLVITVFDDACVTRMIMLIVYSVSVNIKQHIY
jgi:hypothetical protein